MKIATLELGSKTVDISFNGATVCVGENATGIRVTTEASARAAALLAWGGEDAGFGFQVYVEPPPPEAPPEPAPVEPVPEARAESPAVAAAPEAAPLEEAAHAPQEQAPEPPLAEQPTEQ